MYDPLETDISREQLNRLISESKARKCSVALLGGWAAYFFINDTYRRAFGRDYMGSRDIDLFIDPRDGEEFAKLITELGFLPNGMFFRYERIYDREKKQFITPDESKKTPIFNIIYIFLDLFSSKDIPKPVTWSDLQSLANFDVDTDIVLLQNTPIVKMDILLDLKCTAIFARDKADKENKDACDLYSLLIYGNHPYQMTELLKKTIQKILSRNDLVHTIAEHVLLDASKQSIVINNLQKMLH